MSNRILTGHPDDYFDMRFNRLERESLRELAASTKLNDRVLCLDWLENGRAVRANVNFIIELAEQLAWDRRKEVRWYASARILFDYVQEHPAKIWPVTVRLGASRSPDLRSAVAVCLLEQLLEYHYDEYFLKIRDKIEAGDRKMLEMLAISYHVGQAALHKDEINAVLIENHASVTWIGPGVSIPAEVLERVQKGLQRAQAVIEDLLAARGEEGS